MTGARHCPAPVINLVFVEARSVKESQDLKAPAMRALSVMDLVFDRAALRTSASESDLDRYFPI